MAFAYLDRLNQKQKEAVVSKARHLQILAGPGSGKTRVLTTRVAHLIKHHKVSPSSIMVATFTKKAAKDMRERLEKDELLGPHLANLVHMGTFHSLCAHYLRMHPSAVGLPKNFRIIDPQESVKVLEKLIEERQGSISSQTRSTLKSYKGIAGEFQTAISKAKNEGFTAKTYADRYMDSLEPLTHDIILVFNAYQQRLILEHLLDFDDLLLYGRDMFELFPEAAGSISHVLVDEFQDTNKVQYHIVHSLCTRKKHLTIVGDPDQSIYGFRNANIANFKMMLNDFNETRVVHLEENYRSTSSILNGALHIIRKDPERIEKGLFTKNSPGAPLSLMHCETEVDESRKIVDEITRIIEYSHGLVKYKDIAVLVRMHYLTQNVESAFKESNIPYEIIGGMRFFERTEIRDLVGYVHFCFNPNDTLSFERTINTPWRGVGDDLAEKISMLSRAQRKTVLDILEDLCGHDLTLGYTLPQEVVDSLKAFTALCTQVKTMMDHQAPVAAILNHIIRITGYENYLAFTYSNHEIRWENVGELISVAHSHDTRVVDADGSERLVGDVGAFIERTTLDLDSGDSSQGGDKDKVQVMTIHAAKGLEWPCVFLIACEDAIIPHIKAKNVNEERRLLYVAMTRAKCFLYNTYVHKRVCWGEAKRAYLSPFLTEMETTMYVRRTPAWNKESRAWVASVLHLPAAQNDMAVDHAGDVFADYNLLGSQQTLSLLTNGQKRVYECDELDDDDFDFDFDVFDDSNYYSDFEFGYDSDFGISDNDGANSSQACSAGGTLRGS